MLIRSQNKAILLNFSNSTVVYIVKNDKDFVILSLENENRYRLGKYSSEAKAMKVLNMIQEAYVNGHIDYQMPVNLYRWICQKYLQKGMMVLDTHVGSASSLIAYEEYGIEYIGYEINECYYNDACKRLEELRSQIALFDLGVKESDE